MQKWTINPKEDGNKIYVFFMIRKTFKDPTNQKPFHKVKPINPRVWFAYPLTCLHVVIIIIIITAHHHHKQPRGRSKVA